jgi:hypothetical protein
MNFLGIVTLPRSASKSSTSRKLSVNRRYSHIALMYDLRRETISSVADFPYPSRLPCLYRVNKLTPA